MALAGNIEKIREFIRLNIEQYKFKGAIVGISGGIDSAVVGKLLVDSLGRDKVLGLILPERDSDPSTIDDAQLVCNFLGINNKIVTITGVLRRLGVYSLKPPAFLFPKIIQKKYARSLWKNEDDPFIQDLTTQGDKRFLEALAYYRTKPRIRSVILYFEAEQRNYAVAGCTNKTEYVTGFYTKWGDEACDIEPIRHLYKTELFRLAKQLNIPRKIIEKKPTPDIAPGINDELALGMDYTELDRILIKIENGENLASENQEKVKTVEEILRFSTFREAKQLHLQSSSKTPMG